jgi:hypothetical protein
MEKHLKKRSYSSTILMVMMSMLVTNLFANTSLAANVTLQLPGDGTGVKLGCHDPAAYPIQVSADSTTISIQCKKPTSPSPTPSPSPSPSPTVSPTPSPTVSPTPSPTVSPTPSPTPTTSPSPMPSSAIKAWANDGGDKVTQDETRMSSGKTVTSKIWDGKQVNLIGSKNEVLGFQVLLESTNGASNVSVKFNSLANGSSIISSTPATKDQIFNYVGRNIELFYTKYLQIKGLSALSYETYDERHVPKRFQRSYDSNGVGTGTWSSRPDANKYYPDILVPMELKPTFAISAKTNQSVWVDVYVPKTAAVGNYTGNFEVYENGVKTQSIPVVLTVKNITLPDSPSSKTMVFFGYGDVNDRYIGERWPNSGTANATAVKKVRDNHFLLAHRHKLSLIDSGEGPDAWSKQEPRTEWVPKLNGTFFTSTNGYDGPGVSTGNGVYSIGTYGSWNWSKDQTTMKNNATTWENWFKTNASSTERFLYLIDESTNYTQTEQWAGWVKPSGLKTFATIPVDHANSSVPSLSIAASWFSVAPTSWETTVSSWLSGGHNFYVYNGKRPASPSFATEDDGVALRILPWVQYKKKVDRWFFWESTYYNDYQGGRGQTNVFQTAATFSGTLSTDSVKGETGWNHSNGDGLLLYPGTDKKFPTESFDVSGPLASYRLKMWRRGIQDVDYISLAYAKDPTATMNIVNQMVPKVLWENGVTQASDPTWWRGAPSWSISPDDWENAKSQLIAIIGG